MDVESAFKGAVVAVLPTQKRHDTEASDSTEDPI